MLFNTAGTHLSVTKFSCYHKRNKTARTMAGSGAVVNAQTHDHVLNVRPVQGEKERNLPASRTINRHTAPRIPFNLHYLFLFILSFNPS